MRGGLRERKKAATRLAISNVATRLFFERGYEQVTLADVADAADVSVKTILNYFCTKDELYFDRAQQVLDAIADAITERPPGATVLGALHEVLGEHRVPFARDGWGSLETTEGYEGFRAFVAVEHAAPTLRARRLVIGEEWADALAGTLATALGLPGEDPRARTLAALLVAVMALRARVLGDAMMERAAPAEVERRVRAVVDDAFDRLERAYGDLEGAAPAR